MAKRKNGKPGKPSSEKDKLLQKMYATHRREFTAADLQKYTEIEDEIPLKQVIGDCAKAVRRHKRTKG